MKQFIKTITTTLLIACCFTAKAQTQEEMKKWMDYMTPSDAQKMIAKWDGKWDEEITFWMDPTNPGMSQQMTASCENKMILGGRYQHATHSGNFQGMPFEGMSTLAYDNVLKKLIMTWIDNMGTGLMYMEGTWDDATKTATFTGKMTEPMEGKQVNIKQVFRIIDDNTQEITQFQEKNGNEMKTMYIKLTRKK